MDEPIPRTSCIKLNLLRKKMNICKYVVLVRLIKDTLFKMKPINVHTAIIQSRINALI